MAFGEHNIASLQALMEAFRSAGGMQSDRLNRRQQAIGGLNQNIWGANQTIFDLLKQKKELGEAEKERGFVAGEAEKGRTFQAGQGEIGRTFEAGESEKGREAELMRLLKQITSQEKIAGMAAGRELGKRQSDLFDITMGLLKASYPPELWDDMNWRAQNKDNLIKAFRDTIRTFSVTPDEEASLVQAFDSLLFGKIPEKEKETVKEDQGSILTFPSQARAMGFTEEQMIKAPPRPPSQARAMGFTEEQMKINEIKEMIKKLKRIPMADPYEAKVVDEANRLVNKSPLSKDDMGKLKNTWDQIKSLLDAYSRK